jgi:hypothetical protein
MNDHIEQPAEVEPNSGTVNANSSAFSEEEAPREFKIKTAVVIEQPRQKYESVIETIAADPDAFRVKGKRRYRVMQTCGVVCVLIGFIFIFALPPIIGSMITSQAIDQVVMTKEN